MTIVEAMRAYSFRLHGLTWVWTIAKPMPAVAVVELVVDPVPRGPVARPVLDRSRRLGYVVGRGSLHPRAEDLLARRVHRLRAPSAWESQRLGPAWWAAPPPASTLTGTGCGCTTGRRQLPRSPPARPSR